MIGSLLLLLLGLLGGHLDVECVRLEQVVT